MKTYLIADTHDAEIKVPDDCEYLIHLGDEGESKAPECNNILVKGNHYNPGNNFSYECDALRIGEFYFSHEPMERLPRGAAYNIHGHLHYGGYEDYGYKQKPFHYCLEPNKLYSLEEIKKEIEER